MLKTQPNERRCGNTRVEHRLKLPQCCPVSGNPLSGSFIRILYTPNDFILEVAALRQYVDSYQGGKGDVRSMEGMIQAITQDCADCIKVQVSVTANLVLAPNQEMTVFCEAHPQ